MKWREMIPLIWQLMTWWSFSGYGRDTLCGQYVWPGLTVLTAEIIRAGDTGKTAKCTELS